MTSTCVVYILRCSDGSLYVGHASDFNDRVKRHNSGRGAVYTAHRLPVQLVYSEVLPSVEKAVARESQLKRWT